MERGLTIADHDGIWSERCDHWATPISEPKRRGRTARHINEPLLLAGHGIRLKVDQGSLLVTGGFTHYPQKVFERRYFPGDRRMPSRIIIIDGNGSLTLDVMSWLADRNIPLIRIDWRGNAVTMLGNSYGLNPDRVKSQLRAQGRADAVRIATSLILAKFRSCLSTLTALPNSTLQLRAIDKHKREIELLVRSPPRTVAKLLGIEGALAVSYFSAWQSLQVNWKGIKSRPIPVDWMSFGQRSSNKGKTGDNIYATHPVNAFLNYAYAILESHVRMGIIAYGYDPTIGFLHSYKQGRGALVLDLMEPLRAIVDRTVLGFVQSNEFHRADFTVRKDGVCRLNPHMAKRIALLTLKALEGESAVKYLRL